MQEVRHGSAAQHNNSNTRYSPTVLLSTVQAFTARLQHAQRLSAFLQAFLCSFQCAVWQSLLQYATC
jgi:hypothetical protein